MKIIDIKGLQILDSRGNPTLEVTTILDDGSKGVFRVPSGASTGIHEAYELRDNNKNVYHGKSVYKTIENIEKIKNELLNEDFTQKTLDDKLIFIDGTKNKNLLGANTILGISISFAKASAQYHNLPLHEYLNRLINNISFNNKKFAKKEEIHLFSNIINGGLHSGNSLMIQEFMIIPILPTVQEKIRAISEIYQTLKDLIEKKYGKSNTAVGDEGGFAPNISNSHEAFEIIIEAIKQTNYQNQIHLGIDSAASDFFDKNTKLYEIEKGKKLNYKELTKYYNDLINKYPIISIEDPMDEDDFEGFAYFKKNVQKLKINNPLTNNKNILIVGDDLLVTNTQRIQIAQEKKLCNSLLLKINQIGTLSESISAYELSNKNKWHTIISHRSGETTDSFIADFATALNSSIKLGAPARGERTSKYNRLLEIFQK